MVTYRRNTGSAYGQNVLIYNTVHTRVLCWFPFIHHNQLEMWCTFLQASCNTCHCLKSSEMPLLSIHSHGLHEDDHKNAERKGKKRKFHSVKSESGSGGWDKGKDAGWWTQCGNYKCKKLIESQHEMDAADWGNKRRSCPTLMWMTKVHSQGTEERGHAAHPPQWETVRNDWRIPPEWKWDRGGHITQKDASWLK